MICIANLKPQAFLNVNMDEVTTYMINKPAKRSPRISLMRFFCTAKESDHDSRISLGVASSFEICICLPERSWYPVSDEVHVLIFLVKVLHFPGSLMKSPNGVAPCTLERQRINFEKETASYESYNRSKPNNNDPKKATNPSA